MSKQTPLNPNADLNAIGTVKALESADGALAAAWGVKAGSTRLLEVGDGVFAGEVVRTAPETLLTLAMNDGTELAVAEESETTLDSMSTGDSAASKPSLYQRALDRLTGKKEIEIEPSSSTDPDVDALQKALLAGADPSQLEATAAGPAAGGAGNEGSDFVMLQRSSQSTTPESGYDTQAANSPLSPLETEELLPIEINQPPIANGLGAAGDTAETKVGEPVIIDVLANDVDPDGDPLSITSVSSPSNGSVEIVDGKVVYTPADEFIGDDSFSYVVDDGQGGSDTATVFVTVNPVNDDPIGNNDGNAIASADDAIETDEDTPISIDVLANDTDVDGDTLSIDPNGLGTPANGSVEIVNGEILYTPNDDFNGGDSFSYTVVDGQGGSDTATVFVTVNPVNDDPIGNNDGNAIASADDAIETDEDTPISIDVLANDTDVDGDTLSIDPNGLGTPANGSVEIVNGEILYTPNDDFNGGDSFSYTVVDGQGGSDTATVYVTVNPVNDDPIGNNDGNAIASADDAIETDEDTPITIDVLANDTDVDGDDLSIDPNGLGTPANGSVEIVNGEIVYTPNGDFNGGDSFTYTVVDGQGGSDTATVFVTVNPVNDDPIGNNDGNAIASADDAIETDEDTPISIDVLANDTDVDGDTLSIDPNGLGTPANGSVEIVNGEILYTPNDDFNGGDSFSYTVVDGQGGSDTATVFVTVNPVNDDPIGNNDGNAIASADDAIETDEDTPISIDVLANDTDVDGDTLSIDPNGLGTPANGSVEIVNGEILYTPNDDFNGGDSFTYTVVDGQGGSDTATVFVTVNPVNDDPIGNNDGNAIASADDAIETDEDTPISIDVLANDTDVDGDTLSIDPNGLGTPANGSVEIVNGEILYTPNDDFNGGDSFTYTVVDGQGGSDTATVFVTVNPVNDDPIGNNDGNAIASADDAIETDEDTPISIDVLANDTDVDGDTLSIDPNGLGTPSNGSVEIVNGEIVYTPNGDFNGGDSFTYTVVDGQGGSDTATVFVTVNPVNDDPIGNNDGNAIASADDAIETDEDTPISIDVLANDTDVDGDTLSIDPNGLGTPANGSVEIVNGEILYTPNDDFNGGDSFTYTVVDGQGGSDTATVFVTVNPVNDLPEFRSGDDVAGDAPNIDNYGFGTLPEGSTSGTSVGTVIADDADGDTLSYRFANTTQTDGVFTIDAASGEITLNQDIDDGDLGTFDLSVEVSDDNFATVGDTAGVAIILGNVNDAPVAEDDTASTDEDTLLVVADGTLNDVLENDTDVDSASLTVTEVNGVAASVGSQVTLASGALLTLNANGSYSYDPNGQFEDITSDATDSFVYTVSDGALTDSATATITITPVNDAPVAEDDTASTDEDTLLVVADGTLNDVLENDTDVDSASLTVTEVNGVAASVGSQVTLASGALLTLNANGSYSYDPNGQFEDITSDATDSFVYTVSDGALTDSATATITITPVNDAPVAEDDTASTDEDTLLVVADGTLNDVLENDTDVDSASLTVTEVNGVAASVGSQVTLASGALLTLNANGSYSYDPNGQFEDITSDATDSFVYTVSDGALTDSATATITITPVNDAPVAEDDTASTDEDTLLVVADGTLNDVLENDTDVDSASLTVTEVNGVAASVGSQVTLASGALLTLNANGSYSYDPNGQFEDITSDATDSFVYTVSDGALTDSATATITITPVNDAPVAEDDTASTDEDTLLVVADGTLNDVLENDTDVDSASLTVTEVNGVAASVGSQVTLASGALLTLNANGSYSYDPNGQFEDITSDATDSFVYTVSDGALTDSATATITITPVNDAPVAEDDTASTDEDTLLVVADGTLNDVLENDTDVDSASLTVTEVNGVAASVGSQVTLASGALLTLNANGSYSYDPNGQFEDITSDATDSFVYTVSDGALTDSATATITITPVNDAPVAEDDTASTDEDTLLVVADGTLNDVLENDTDVDSASLTVTEVNGVAASVGSQVTLASGALLTLNANGSYSYDPNGQFEDITSDATDSFVYTVSDGALTDSATATITITPVNDAPVAEDDTASTDEDTLLVVADGTLNDVLENDTDVDSASLTVTEVNGVAASVGSQVTLASGALLTLNANGSYSYDPNGQFEDITSDATDSFVYTVSDGALTDSATATITITPVNDAPVAEDDTASTDEDTLLVVADGTLNDVLENDTDVDSASLTVTEVNGVAASVGSQVTLASGALLTLNANGSYSYDPNGQFEDITSDATDSFVYTVSDGALTDSATATITITPVNDAPVAEDDTASTDEDTLLVVADGTLNDVLENDTDVDSASLTVTEVNGVAASVGSQVTLASGALLTLNANGSYSYDPNGQFEDITSDATDSFVYTVSDGALTDSATATITITPVNDAPVAEDDTASTDEDTLLVVADGTLNDVLENDTDVDSASLTVTEVNGVAASVGSQVTLASGALLTLNANGSYSYDPNGQFEDITSDATDSFVYTVSDGALTDSATATITITPVNDAPVAEDDTASTDEDTLLVVADGTLNDVLENDTDVDSASLTVTEVNGVAASVGSQVTLASGALLTLNANGSYSYDPNGQFEDITSDATDSFVYTVSDGALTDSATATITITPVNDAPVAEDDTASTDEDTLLVVADGTLNDVLENDTDVDSASLTVTEVNGVAASVGSQVTLASGALLTLNANGSYSYDPNGQFEDITSDATDSFVYTVSDGALTDSATATITITPVNDAPVAEDDTASTDEDTLLVVADGTLNDVLENDTDVDSASLTVTEVNGVAASVGSQVTLASGALLTLNANGSYSYDPNGQFEDITSDATDSFVYTVSDGALTDSATATITITPVNDAPVAEDDTASTDEDTLLVVADGTLNDVLENDTDVDSASLTVTEVNGVAASVGSQVTLASGALLTLNANGSYSYDPNGQFEDITSDATDSFVYTVSDGALTDSATATITITPVNDAPVAEDDTASTDEDTLLVVADGTLNDVLENDTDVDSASLTVTEVNGVAASVGSQVTLASGALLTLNANGSYSYDPNGQFEDITSDATDSFVYTVSDGALTDSATATITITPVNDAPVAEDDTASTDEDTLLVVADGTLNDVLENDTDVDSASLTVTEVNGVAASVGSQVTLASGALLTLNANGSYSYDPNGQFEDITSDATDSFVYTVSDGALTDSATATITITPVNDAPVAEDDTASTDEDTLLVVADGTLNDVLENDTDVDSASLTVTEVNGVAASVGSQVTLASGALLTLNANGSYSYDPNGQFEDITSDATDSFVYTVSDGALTDSATATITITPVNDAPVAEDDTASTDEDTLLVVADGTLNDVLENDTDVDSASLTVTEVNGVAASVGSQVTLASGALLTLNANGSYSYDPNGQFEDITSDATDSFVYTVSDGALTDSATATITITPVNDAPVAEDDTASTDEDTLLVVADGTLNDVLENDTDVDSASLTVTEVNGVAASVGSQVTLASGALLTLNANGSYSYDPNGQFEDITSDATDSFVYTVSDGALTDSATATITITPVNDAPVAEDDTASTDEDTLLVVADGTLNDVLENDTDVDSASLTVTEVNGVAASVGSQVTLASGALLTLNANGSYSYDPNGQFEDITSDATDSFVYTVSDGALTDSATATITITPVNDAPVVDSSEITVDEESENTPLGLEAPTDVDGDDLTITVTGLPTLGTVTLADGTPVTVNQVLTAADLEGLQYDAPADYTAGDAVGDFTYNVTDGTETVGGATDIVVNPVDDPISITGISGLSVYDSGLPGGNDLSQPTVDEGTFSVEAGDGIQEIVLSDPNDPSDRLTISLAQLLAIATVGPFTYTTALGNTLSITNYVGDETGGTVSYSYTLVAAEDHPDTQSADSIVEDVTVTVRDLAGDVRESSATLSTRIFDDVPEIDTIADQVVDGGETLIEEVPVSYGADGAYPAASGPSLCVDSSSFTEVDGMLERTLANGTREVLAADGLAVTGYAVDGFGQEFELYTFELDPATGNYEFSSNPLPVTTLKLFDGKKDTGAGSAETLESTVSSGSVEYKVTFDGGIVLDTGNGPTLTDLGVTGTYEKLDNLKRTGTGFGIGGPNGAPTHPDATYSEAGSGQTDIVDGEGFFAVIDRLDAGGTEGVQSFSFSIDRQGGGGGAHTLETHYRIYSTDDQGDVLEETSGNISSDFQANQTGYPISLSADFAFTHVEVWFSGVPEGNQNYRVVDFEISNRIEVPDQDLSFDIKAVDGDGDTSESQTVNIDLVNVGLSLTGSVDGDYLTGGSGNDLIDGLGGADTINAGAGNDTIIYDSNDVVIDGGEAADGADTSDDMDTLLIDGSLSGATGIENIEVLSMVDNQGDDIVTLNEDDVTNMTDGSNVLQIDGDGGVGNDSVALTGGTWSLDPNAGVDGYDVYQSSTINTVIVQVHQDIDVTLS